jgi:hypothetical protein
LANSENPHLTQGCAPGNRLRSRRRPPYDITPPCFRGSSPERLRILCIKTFQCERAGFREGSLCCPLHVAHNLLLPVYLEASEGGENERHPLHRFPAPLAGASGGPLPLLIGWRLLPRDADTGRPSLSPPLSSPSPLRGSWRRRAGFLDNLGGRSVHTKPGARKGVLSAAARQRLLWPVSVCPGVHPLWAKVSDCHLLAFRPTSPLDIAPGSVCSTVLSPGPPLDKGPRSRDLCNGAMEMIIT